MWSLGVSVEGVVIGGECRGCGHWGVSVEGVVTVYKFMACFQLWRKPSLECWTHK